MMTTDRLGLGIGLVLILFMFGAHATDLGKEKRWADQIVDELMLGDAVWLHAGGRKFLGIYTESEIKNSKSAVIILHGVGVHPNWADVIHPLRTRLPAAGWHTLSLQMPILPNDANVKEYIPLFSEISPRINDAVKYLKAKGVTDIVLIGHSMGATMAGFYVANSGPSIIRALVTIGAAGYLFKDPKRDMIQSLKSIQIPVLDVSGGEDLADVVNTKKLKAETSKAAGNKFYYQIEIPGANHFLVGKEDELVAAVSGWLVKFKK